MWKIIGANPTVAYAGTAVLCTVVTQHISTRQSELCSDILCWMLLPILFKVVKRSNADIALGEALLAQPASRPTSSSSLWIVAVGVVTVCYFKAEIGMIELLPVLTPLLLISEKKLCPDLQALRMLDPWPVSFLNTFGGSALVAAFSIFIIADCDFWTCALSAVPVATMTGVYVAFMPTSVETEYFLPFVNLEEAVVPLALRVLILSAFVLCVEAVAFGLPIDNISLTLSLGGMKALSWYFVTTTARHSSWLVAASITNFSVLATRDPFMQSSEFQASSHVMASFLNLCQTINILPKRPKARSTLWVLILISLIPYLANISAIRISQNSAPSSFNHFQEHPIEVLMRNGKAKFESLLQSQSKNYTAADMEYRHRYGLEPPPGFDAWYEFASTHQSPIIDDYDIIFDTISPFWNISGEEFITIMNEVQHEPDSDLWHCAFSGGRAKTRCTHPDRDFDRNIELFFNQVLEDLPGAVADVNFLVNHLDEPRVLVPPRLFHENMSYGGQFTMTDLSNMPSWNAITKFCLSQQGDSSPRAKKKVETFALPFVEDRHLAINLCQHPEYSTMHGLVMSPTSFSLIEGLVPILTTGSPSTMGDLLFPSPAYIDSEFRYDEVHDIEWDAKKNNLYWTGSTTGGFASDNKWRDYQRQRFVSLAQNLESQQHYYLREEAGIIRAVKSLFLNSRLFDVGFTNILQCERKICRDQSTFFKIKRWAGKDQALRSRLVFDIDGNGISGRYYKLLASNSVPLKQTVFREWHDDRLIPWVHYVPVSQGLKEVPELVFYLTSTDAGQGRARQIAEQGKEWFSRAFRDVDLTIYTYRLLLELARLQDPERQAR